MSNAIRSQGTKLQRAIGAALAGKAITSMKATGTTVTVITQAPHGLNNGDQVVVSGAKPDAYNGTYNAIVVDPSTYTFSLASAPGSDATVPGAYTATTFSYTDIDEATDIKIGGVSVSAIDVTHLLSLAKEFVGGLVDNGSIDVTFNFTNSDSQKQMRADLNKAAMVYYRVVIPATTPINFFFLGLITKFDGPTAKTDNKMEMTTTIKVSGAIIVY